MRVNRDRTQRFGVNPEVVAGTVGYALRGRSLPRYRDGGREIPVRVRFQEEDRNNLGKLESFAVPTESGAFVPLSSVVDSEVVKSYRGILRRNKRVSGVITLELEEDKEEETRAMLAAITSSMDLPEGIQVSGFARRQGLDEDLAGMKFASILSVLFIYLLMGFLFESFILPLSIMLTIPLGARSAVMLDPLPDGRDIDFLGAGGHRAA